MSNAPLMPKATAVWLVDNTALTFDQVADFTKMHPLEVRARAVGPRERIANAHYELTLEGDELALLPSENLFQAPLHRIHRSVLHRLDRMPHEHPLIQLCGDHPAHDRANPVDQVSLPDVRRNRGAEGPRGVQ